jgi:hypothetical protein
MAPSRQSGRVSRRAVLRTLSAATIGAAVGATYDGFSNERHRLGVTRVTLPVSGLPGAFEGLRVALLTDLHLSPLVDAADIAAAVAMTLAEQPDLIVLGGDYVTWGHEYFIGPVAELLSPLTAPLGVMAVLGNHDSDTEVTGALERNGFTVLRDAHTRLERRGDALDFIGVRYWTRQRSTLAGLIDAPGNVNILLAHDPRRLTEAADLNLPLVLSGHTHGGQIVLPGLGAWNRGFPTMQGTIERDNSVLFVSRGIGMVYVPMRINCPPEVAMLTLERRGDLA